MEWMCNMCSLSKFMMAGWEQLILPGAVEQYDILILWAEFKYWVYGCLLTR